MKRFFIIALGMIIGAITYSQQAIRNWTENFDGTVTFNAKGVGLWSSINHASPSSLPKSYLGQIPNTVGDTNILETITFDCGIYNYVYLRFDHICMVSPDDIVKVQYRIDMGGGMGAWDSLPITAYQGKANNFNPKGVFNNASYSEWSTLSMPPYQNSQWKEESFDLTFEAQRSVVQFRFLIIHGSKNGSQANFGWLIDNFRLDASVYEVYPPTVEWMTYVEDTVYATGPHEIKAKVATRTSHPIVPPYLVYTATRNNVSVHDSIPMTNVAGDSIWTGTIPQYPAGTTVFYSITGKDSVGNEDDIATSYIITAGGASSVIVTGNSSNDVCWTPFSNCENIYGWSRMIYRASVLGSATTGMTILGIEWEGANGISPVTVNNQKCWLQAINITDSVIDGNQIACGYINPTTLSDAVQVFSGSLTIKPGWCGITFSTPFYLPPGKNLQVHWENMHGTKLANVGFVHHSPYAGCVVNGHGTSLAGTQCGHDHLPNARFSLLSSIDDNSVALHAINIADTIIVSPTTMVPLSVVVKNKGKLDLTSATIKHTINGVSGQPYTWSKTGNLLWDMNDTVTLVNYKPKVNGKDTIKVWVELPNGQIDALTVDDTLSKAIYCSADISMSFVNSPVDTVRNTGPFAINASISSLTGASIGPIYLKVITTFEGVPTTDSLLMTYDAAAKLWKTTIPQTQYGSDISYSISLTDIVGNNITETNNFYLRRSLYNVGGEEIIGGSIGAIYNRDVPIHTYHYTSWSKQLYLESEIDEQKRGGVITKIWWNYYRNNGSGPSTWSRNNQRCYMRLVNDVNLNNASWAYYDDPSLNPNDIKLVWGTKTLQVSSTGWVEIELDQPFTWTKGKNLLIYWENADANTGDGSRSKTSNPSYEWSHTKHSSGNVMTIYTNNDNGWTAQKSEKAGNINSDRPDLKINILAQSSIDTSVALVSVESPVLSAPVSGQTVPLQVKIQNKGIKYLTSCTIKWTVNGGAENSYLWDNDTLPEEFTRIVTLDNNYQATQYGKNDTIVVWVENPNGVDDQDKTDDTLTVFVMGCAGNIQGNQIVGSDPSADFASITDVIQAIKECGVAGNLTLQLKGTYNENVDLTNMTPYLKGHRLTITSLDNNADSVIINPSSGVGITLGNSRDITIEKITVNRASVTTHAIQFTSACTNIVIRDCKLLTNPTTTSQIAPIYKAENTGIVDSIFMIHNILDGGHAGLHFYGGISSGSLDAAGQYGTNVIFDSNTVTNTYHYGMRVDVTDFLHISHNTFTNRTVTSGERWDILSLHQVNGDIIGNRMYCNGMNNGSEALHLQRYNQFNTTKTALIANNDLILFETGTGVLGVYNDWVNAYYLHNSFYISNPSGDACAYFMEAVNRSNLVMKNNNFVTNGSSSGRPLILYNGSGYVNQYDIDYNNFYTIGNQLLQYSGAKYNTLTQFAQYFPTANNMTSVMPNYLDINVNTELLASNTNLYCPLLPSVTTDIEGKPRTGQATMGAYQIIPIPRDLSLEQFVTFDTEVVENQTVQLTVEVQNFGNTPVQNAVLGWSINGQTQTPYPWTPTAPLAFGGQENVTVGSFTVDNSTTTYDIVVWVDSVNHDLDMDQRKDTLTIVATKKPLVEFVAPLVGDTINRLTFDVNAVIRTGSGVSVTPAPQLKIRTVVNGNHTINSSILMTLSNGVWKASIPQQYYGANVVYSITVTDTTGITTTAEDSVYIQYTASSTPYSGHNLTIMNMLTPVNDPNDLCTPNYSLVQAIIRNLGTDNYNFIQNFIALGVEVINPLGTKDSAYIIKNTGTLESGKMDTVLLMPALLVRYPGVYDIKVWVKSSIDNVPYDDTLVYKFVSGRIGLPIDEDFSGSEIPHQFVPVCLVPSGGTNTWQPYTDTTGKILPPSSSNGMLRYAGKRGSMAKLTIRHLDLYQSVDPKMIYWYYYDTTNLDRDNTYTIIRVIMDDVPTVVRTLYRKSSVHGWQADTIDLNNFTNGQCVLIEFESMNGHDLAAQYLGHVTITSIPDLKVSEIIISPKEAVCNLTNRNIQVVLSTVANQAIDFTAIKDTLVVEIGSQPPAYYYYSLTETLEGNASDTFTIARDVDLTGVSEIKAYLTTPVDNNPSNDIKTYLIDIHPQLELTVLSSTGGVSCFETGIQATQEIILKNTGNIDLTGIELILRLTVGEDFTEPVRNPETIDLAVGSSIQYTLKNTYTVPEEDYLVQIFAYVGCDSAGINITNVTDECVDLHNLSMGTIISPLPNKKDTVKTTQTLSVTVINTDKVYPFVSVPVRAQIENENGQILNTLIGTVSEIVPSDTVSYTFIEKYTVPEDSLYFIRIFVSSNDLYPKNDTIIAKRETVPADTINIDIVSIENLNTFTLGQNIPNPANNMTRIDYNIPEAGKVIFCVHSISGQLLHSETIEVTRGIHSIELNTNKFSAGIYYYSIEYKGQRLVKRMSVN